MLPASGEQNYLAIVVLAEGVLAATDWKQLSESSLKLLRGALALGLEDRTIEYDDYLVQIHALHANGVRAGPTFELSDVPGGLRETDDASEINHAKPNSPADPVR